MALDLATLRNISTFLDRANSVGNEALAWVQTKNAVTAEINALTAPPKAVQDAVHAAIAQAAEAA